MALVCKRCGHKQYCVQTIYVYKHLYPGMEEHDIPYLCMACEEEALWAEGNMLISLFND